MTIKVERPIISIPLVHKVIVNNLPSDALDSEYLKTFFDGVAAQMGLSSIAYVDIFDSEADPTKKEVLLTFSCVNHNATALEMWKDGLDFNGVTLTFESSGDCVFELKPSDLKYFNFDKILNKQTE